MSEEKNRKEKKRKKISRGREKDGRFSAMRVRLKERADVGDARNPDREERTDREKSKKKEKRDRIEGKIVRTL